MTPGIVTPGIDSVQIFLLHRGSSFLQEAHRQRGIEIEPSWGVENKGLAPAVEKVFRIRTGEEDEAAVTPVVVERVDA